MISIIQDLQESKASAKSVPKKKRKLNPKF
jgi:hypothetical protein